YRGSFLDKLDKCLALAASEKGANPDRNSDAQRGLSRREIAKILGISKATIKNCLEDYPYKG
ncbi:MAG: hypothetical protein KAV87_27585, partial [Desulfobacteraceae bacterium]|nr:hypothetical protein [Desulfobacteraceae bacterium]